MAKVSFFDIPTRTRIKIILFISLLGVFVACGKKDPLPENANFSPLQVSLKLFQGVTSDVWKKNSAGDLLTNISTLSLAGVCGPQVVSIVLKIDDVAVATAPVCDSHSLWSYSGSLAGPDATTDIKISGLDSAGGQDATLLLHYKVVKDTLAPTIASIDFPISNPEVIVVAQAVISGTLTGDAASMTSSDMTGVLSLNLAGGTFTFVTYLSIGEVRNITFKVYDEVGNESSPVSQTISRLGDYESIAPPTGMYQLSGMSNASLPMSNGGYDLVTSGLTTMGSAVTVSNGGYDLSLGLVNQTVRY